MVVAVITYGIIVEGMQILSPYQLGPAEKAPECVKDANCKEEIACL